MGYIDTNFLTPLTAGLFLQKIFRPLGGHHKFRQNLEGIRGVYLINSTLLIGGYDNLSHDYFSSLINLGGRALEFHG